MDFFLSLSTGFPPLAQVYELQMDKTAVQLGSFQKKQKKQKKTPGQAQPQWLEPRNKIRIHKLLQLV